MNTHNDHHDHSGGFMNGLLFGVIIGAAVVFFLFTDKGKRLLKTITEEGIEGFADLKDLVEDELDEEEEEDYDAEDVYEEPEKKQKLIAHRDSHIEPLPHHEDYVEEEHKSPSKVKRFFRGIKR